MDRLFLERCEAITRAYQKNSPKWNTSYQLLKIFEEVGEVHSALKNHDLENLKEELCDVILASLTMFHILEISPNEIAVSMEKVLKKVEYRCDIRHY